MYVDVNTGVLLKYIGYDENNALSDYLYTENISYENEAETVKSFSNEMVTGFQKIQ